MKGIAFAPGHISAFFEPVYCQQDLDRTGSCGAGMSISLGAISRISIEPASQQIITVKINGKQSTAGVTKTALRYLIGDIPLKIMVDTIIDLPVSQGFGMSAAGALSATLALTDFLDLPREKAVKAAHYAEIQSHTGLGDVVASSFGGIEIRRKAGLPPWGILEHIPGNCNLVLCVVGEKIETKKILTNMTKVREISSLGRKYTKKLLENPTLEHLFSLGWEFTQKIDIADSMVLDAIKKAKEYGMASMCMLGNSVFAMGDTPALYKILSEYGTVFCCSIDELGARVLQEQ